MSGDRNYWQDSAHYPKGQTLTGDVSCDVAIIGGGFSGVNAALTLGFYGVDAIVLEAEHAGFGASGRNGGFCCYGGVKHELYELAQHHGVSNALAVHHYLKSAIEYVAGFLSEYGEKTLRSKEHGELCIALNRQQLTNLENSYRLNKGISSDYSYEVLSPSALKERGYNTEAVGAVLRHGRDFGLHPGQYLAALINKLIDEGLPYYEEAPIERIQKKSNGFELITKEKTISARKILYATNAFSEHAIAKNILKAYSNVIVTEPLPSSLLKEQGWVHDGPAFDAKNLLHYFRLLSDNRFLIGGRGAKTSDSSASGKVKEQLTNTLYRRWPSFSEAKIDYFWGGPVAITPNRFPFVGQLTEGSYATYGYHGNGVAMASYSGQQVALQMLDKAHQIPTLFQQPKSYPLSFLRPLYLKLAYGYYGLVDARG